MKGRSLSLAAASGPALIVSARAGDGVPDYGYGMVTFPLLSHRGVVERRRRELRSAGRVFPEVKDDDTGTFDRIPHPHRAPGGNGSLHARKGVLHKNDRFLVADQQLGALYQGYGTHYVDVWLGYPAQRQTAVVDTGSSVTAFPCSECADCGRHTDPPFDETKSGSFDAESCSTDSEDSRCVFGKCDGNGLCMIEHSFGAPGSPGASGWTAYEAKDVAYAGGPHDRAVDAAAPPLDPGVEESNPVHATEFSFPLTFGCQTSVSGYFKRQLASGVMGLDRRAQSFWGQMRASQVIKRAQFSLCFVKQPIASMSGSTAGAITLGGTDKRLHLTPMVFAKSVGEGTTASFKVRMRKVYLREGNGQSVMYDAKSKYHVLQLQEQELNGNEMYNFDSGTTDTYLIKSLSVEFRRVWKEVTAMDYTNDPITVNSDSDLLKFPTLILQIVPHDGGLGDEVQEGYDPRTIPGLAGNVDMATPNDVMLAIPPKHYMQRNSADGTYSSRIYLDREDVLGNVLGANAMMGHDIMFDMDSARIGFSESDCDYAKLVAKKKGVAAGDTQDSANLSAAPGSLTAAEDDGYKICGSMKCRGFFGLTLAVFFCLFFLFARRYVTKRDSDGERGGRRHNHPEYEMKSRNLQPDEYKDDAGTFPGSSRYSDNSTPSLPSGEGRRYRDDIPPSSYYEGRSSCHGKDKDHISSRHLEHSGSGRRSRSDSREGHRERRGGERRGSRDPDERRPRHEHGEHRAGRSGSRDSAGNSRSAQSIHSGRSHGSGGSGGSRETRRSSRSHRSSATHLSGESRESHRSRESERSARTNRSRESQRSSRSRRHMEGGSRKGGRSHRSEEERDYGKHSPGNRSHYRDDYDDIPLPPSIA